MSSRIAIIFDFDETLAEDATSGFLRTLGLDAETFWRQRVQRWLDDDWDPIPAYLHEMLVESRSRPPDDRITQQRLAEWGTQLTFFEGVEEIFDTLREEARAVDSAIDVEFYLISSGIGEILRHCAIAQEFKDIWACDFHYDEAGAIVFPKNIVSFTEKTKFLYKVSKGLIGPESRGRPFDVNERVVDGQFRIPIKQFIVVGDGQTDIPCFALVRHHKGLAFAVYDPDHPGKWGRAFRFIKQRRVEGLYTANYREGGDLRNALRMAVADKAREIAEAMRAVPR